MPGPIIAKPQLPGWMDPAQASVFDVPGQGMLRKIVGMLGLDDPNQVMAFGTPLETGPNTGGLLEAVAQKFPRFANAIKAYHGSTKPYPMLQPGSMMTTDPAWAAGYTTSQVSGIGPDRFVGTVHAAEVPLSERSLTATSLHDAEKKLLDLHQQATGSSAATLREAAATVRQHYGYESIVAKDRSGTVTGIIPLTDTPVTEHLSPLQIVRQAMAEGRPIPENLQEAARLEGLLPPIAGAALGSQKQDKE